MLKPLPGNVICFLIYLDQNKRLSATCLLNNRCIVTYVRTGPFQQRRVKMIKHIERNGDKMNK